MPPSQDDSATKFASEIAKDRRPWHLRKNTKCDELRVSPHAQQEIPLFTPDELSQHPELSQISALACSEESEWLHHAPASGLTATALMRAEQVHSTLLASATSVLEQLKDNRATKLTRLSRVQRRSPNPDLFLASFDAASAKVRLSLFEIASSLAVCMSLHRRFNQQRLGGAVPTEADEKLAGRIADN